MISVINNAYLRRAQSHPNYSFTHQNLLILLLTEKKYYAKDELLCLAEYNLNKLEKIIKDLEKIGVIKQEGWLVKIVSEEEFNQVLLLETTQKKSRKQN